MEQLISQLESILFVASKPLNSKMLAKFTGSSEEDVSLALQELGKIRSGSGIVLLQAGNNFQLATNKDNVELVKNFLNADLREQLTDATLEVLAIIAYRGPISKPEIEAIRGVNSQYSVRALLMRGMIEKVSNPSDGRGFVYQVTTEFLQHLGLQSTNDLPEFETLTSHIKMPETTTKQDAENHSPEE